MKYFQKVFEYNKNLLNDILDNFIKIYSTDTFAAKLYKDKFKTIEEDL